MAYRNRALHHLDPADLAVIEPHLELVEVAKDEVLIEQGGRIDMLHFPESALITNVIAFSDGSSVDASLVALEGVTGLAPFLADVPCGWRVRVLIAGQAYRLPAAVLRGQLDRSPALRNLMLRLTNDYQAQSTQAAACNARHQTRQRLARWLLEMDDRMGAERLRLTQQDLADVLGMTRPSLQVEASALREAGAIDYLRGAIRINRQALGPFACECHEMDLQRSREQGLAVPRDA